VNGQHQTTAAILAIGTAVPRYQARQADVVEWMIASFTDRPAVARLLRSLYASSGIETRHSCIADFLHPAEHSRFAPGRPLAELATTAERMAIYEREAAPLGAEAATQALAQLAKRERGALSAATCTISHLVVVSCTGFFAPGLDLALAKQLNLAPQVERTMIGFMGCAAAFNGLRAAAHIVRSQPTARVLVVCVELCSLHVQPGVAREHLISSSLFADGAAACVVGAANAETADAYLLEGFFSQVKADAHSAMVWQIGNHGFALQLSPQIPRHLAAIAPAALNQLIDPVDAQFWAIHPGGPAIVDRLAEVFDLSAEQVEASRSVLRRIGNVSSGTVFFVLDQLRSKLQERSQPQTGVAMAFGPGLVIEMLRLTYVPANATVPA
jgi:predicted naringenin-chalcone synthase